MTWAMVFFGAAVLVAFTPGANNLLGLHHGMTQGVWKGLAGLLGRLAAFTVLIAAVAAGLGQLLAASELALTVIKWAGVTYLVWIGGRLLWSTFRAERTALVQMSRNAESLPAPRIARKEFVVAITNPKAILIFTAFVPQFIDAAHGSFPTQIAILGAIYLLAEFVAGATYVGVGALVRSLRLSRRATRNVDRGTGVVLLGMAGTLAASNS
ncbi:lysine transporter LysE [Amycolatopsis thailandensis]|uniref:Lysine transporter LysE n=1 Tax=Amycolatopsis thailandensis TaxID=589330 RepID=A0A229RJ57_9PSEU|nr:LysE family translocator [Amycolatopsis thailandensis]OXM46708.1 lysine transporter LysE [Amycolatopsis thailandensis]